MRVLFVHSVKNAFQPDRPLRQWEQIQFGISYISAVLQQHGHTTDVVVFNSQKSAPFKATLEEELRRFRPDVVGFTGVFTEHSFLGRVSRYLRAHHPNIYTVVGGAHAQLYPEKALVDGDFDALCTGEGEHIMVQLLEQLTEHGTATGIDGMWFRRPDGIERNAKSSFEADLDTMPHPDRRMWRRWVADDQNSRMTILLGRGCPFLCTYCSNHVLRKTSTGRFVRFRDPDAIVAELRELTRMWPDKRSVRLVVETIGVRKQWLYDFCDALAAFNETLDEPLCFSANLRITPRMDTDRLFSQFAKANFDNVTVGLESGSERVRSTILKRHYPNAMVVQTARSAKKHGVKLGLYNLIGIPGETRDDFLDTIALNRACQPDFHALSIFFPYPGTELWEETIALGIDPDAIDVEAERTVAKLDLPGFSRRQIQHYFDWFDVYAFHGVKPAGQLARTVVLAKSQRHPRMHTAMRRTLATRPLRRVSKMGRSVGFTE
ncbi:MAG: anaerobic magnesium-protoporphyrin IX monomethyl ester cyclase [Kiritimatiellia bacterium]|jgi:anaerobic magnesium-protoporphyrin IX monomethyl ester cyclase